MKFITVEGKTVVTHKPSLIVYDHTPGTGRPLRYMVEVAVNNDVIESYEVTKQEYDRLVAERQQQQERARGDIARGNYGKPTQT